MFYVINISKNCLNFKQQILSLNLKLKLPNNGSFRIKMFIELFKNDLSLLSCVIGQFLTGSTDDCSKLRPYIIDYRVSHDLCFVCIICLGYLHTSRFALQHVINSHNGRVIRQNRLLNHNFPRNFSKKQNFSNIRDLRLYLMLSIKPAFVDLPLFNTSKMACPYFRC